MLTLTQQGLAVGSPASRQFDLSGMTIMVTGASSGIGRATALNLMESGAELVLVARNEDALRELGSEVQSRSGRAPIWLAFDATELNVARQSIAALPKLHGLVNNAGQNIPEAFSLVSEDHFDAIFDLNVKAAFFVAQACVAKFRETGGGGAIVNISSQMGHVGAASRTVYCASKHALEGLTKALAVELGGEGIRVNSVCPTFISTAMTEPMFREAEFRNEVVSKIPLGRIGTPCEVVGAITFLLSPAASLITGASLLIDGGWTAQ